MTTKTEVKERPILFSGEMVRAILEGQKTQTRRVVKPSVMGCTVGVYAGGGPTEAVNVQEDGDPWTNIKCPYGIPGDRLIPAMEIPSLNRNYCADIYGNIWSRARDGVTWKKLKPSPTDKGYLSVTPAHNGKYKTRLVHRLVAEAFYSVEPNGLKQIRHLNGDQKDNAPENLDWGTQEDNWSDRLAHGKSLGEDHHNSKLKQWQIDEIVASKKPQRSLASDFGVSQSTIWAVKNRKYWQENPMQNPTNCPRWASRILLKITDVRVERVQGISEEDCYREGIGDDNCRVNNLLPDGDHCPKCGWLRGPSGVDGGSWVHWPRKDFENLWNSINEKRGYGWDVNPWVWVIEFKRLGPNHP